MWTLCSNLAAVFGNLIRVFTTPALNLQSKSSDAFKENHTYTHLPACLSWKERIYLKNKDFGAQHPHNTVHLHQVSPQFQPHFTSVLKENISSYITAMFSHKSSILSTTER